MLVCPPVDAVKAPRFWRVGSEKDGVWADPVAVHSCRSLQVVDKQQAQLSDHVHQPILVAYLHGYWEVICKLLGEEKLCLALERRLACRAEGRDGRAHDAVQTTAAGLQVTALAQVHETASAREQPVQAEGMSKPPGKARIEMTGCGS